jgi:hypothetical protein
MRHHLLCVSVALLSGSLGCSVAQKKQVLETAFDEQGRRHEYFEATLRVLDEKPEYVDESFAQANRHPKVMDRFVENTARDLREEKLAQLVARHLCRNPESLHQVLIQTQRAAKDDANARQAIAAAIEDESTLATDVIADRPSAISATLEGTVAAIADKPEARAAFLEGMQRTSPEISRYLANNPKTLKAMTKALLDVALSEKKATVKQIMKELSP